MTLRDRFLLLRADSDRAGERVPGRLRMPTELAGRDSSSSVTGSGVFRLEFLLLVRNDLSSSALASA